MSSRGPEINFNPLLNKVQNDINILCYLGLHQYAKEHQLIGRSRPMITKELSFVKQKRLNFRLMVACIQQIVGTKTLMHGEREEQINYVNVGEYSMLRLYGLLDKDMFAVYTNDRNCYTGYWPHCLSYADLELLNSQRPLKAFEQDLTYNTRATMEVGGHLFTTHLRNAIKAIPRELIEFVPHQQRDPRNRMNVKNIAVPLQLVTMKHYHSMLDTRLTRRGRPVGYKDDAVFIPSHIEQILHFRHVLWPWIQKLQDPGTRESFIYVANNFPSVHAINTKARGIRESQAERERRREAQAEADRQRREAQEQLRERLLATYGDRREHVPEPENEEERVVLFDDIHVGLPRQGDNLQDRILQLLGIDEAGVEEED